MSNSTSKNGLTNKQVREIRVAVDDLSKEGNDGKKIYKFPDDIKVSYALGRNRDRANSALKTYDTEMQKAHAEFTSQNSALQVKRSEAETEKERSVIEKQIQDVQAKGNEKARTLDETEAADFEPYDITLEQLQSIEPVPDPATISRLMPCIKEAK